MALDIIASKGRADHGEGARVALNRKIAGLRDDVPSMARTKIVRRIVDLDAQTSGDQILSLAETLSGGWLDELPLQPVDERIVTDLRKALHSRIAVPVPNRHVPVDAGAPSRAQARLELDLQQSLAAQRSVLDTL